MNVESSPGLTEVQKCVVVGVWGQALVSREQAVWTGGEPQIR
jgi:hypothetical protein